MNWCDIDAFPLGLGTSKLCSVNGGVSASFATYLLESAFEEGIRFFDTAPSYGQGQAEEAIGRLNPRVRNQAFVCSKIGYSYGRSAAVINALKPILRPAASLGPFLRKLARHSRAKVQQQGSISVEMRPATIRTSLSGTLKRLRRDAVDVLLLHDASMNSLTAENSEALESLAKEGLIHRWGVSTSDAAVAHRAIGLKDLGVLEVPVHATWADGAGDLLAKCRERGIDVIANGVLSALHETDKTHSVQSQSDRSVEGCFEFALHQPAVRVVLCGTTDSAHLRANVRAMRNLVSSQGKGINRGYDPRHFEA